MSNCWTVCQSSEWEIVSQWSSILHYCRFITCLRAICIHSPLNSCIWQKAFCNPKYCFFSFLKGFIYFIFRERGKEGEREGEKHHQSYAPRPGIKPAAQARALTRNPNSDLLLCRTMTKQLSHTIQGQNAVSLSSSHNPWTAHSSGRYKVNAAYTCSRTEGGCMWPMYQKSKEA